MSRAPVENVLSDIYDGNVWKELSAPGQFLSVPYSLSLRLNIDGSRFINMLTIVWDLYTESLKTYLDINDLNWTMLLLWGAFLDRPS